MDSILINGVKIYYFSSRDELITYSAIKKKCLVAINAEKIINASEQIRSFINQNIGYADGIGAVWALKKKGFNDAKKIPGCELWLDVVERFYKIKSFYLVGSKEKIISQTVKKLKDEYLGINIVGYHDGYMSNEKEKQQIINTIITKKPDIIFVAMGSPKQELFIQEIQNYHSAIYQGLGGSFDVYVGEVERAPEWWVNNNLEWAFRLFNQPKRFKRQIHLIRFVGILLFDK